MCGCSSNNCSCNSSSQRGPQGPPGPRGLSGTNGSITKIAGTQNTTAQTAASTAEQTLSQFNLPANELTLDSERIQWIVYGTTAANSRTKTIRFNVDGVELFKNTTTASPNGLAWKMEINVFKGANSPGNVTKSFTECAITFNGVSDDLKIVKNVSLNWDQIQTFSISGQVGAGAALGDIIVTGNVGYTYK